MYVEFGSSKSCLFRLKLIYAQFALVLHVHGHDELLSRIRPVHVCLHVDEYANGYVWLRTRKTNTEWQKMKRNSSEHLQKDIC